MAMASQALSLAQQVGRGEGGAWVPSRLLQVLQEVNLGPHCRWSDNLLARVTTPLVERLCAEAFLTGEPAGEHTWGLCVVLRKA